MLTRRTLAALAGATALALSLAAPAMAQDKIVIKFSHVVAPDTPKGKGAAKFEELAEAYTNGAVDVEVYPNSQLYKDKEELEALQLGAVQMLAPSLAKFGPLGVQDFEVFDLPFIFPSYDALRKVEPLRRALDELGARTWFAGLRRSQASTRASTAVLELKHGRWKVHPLIDWTDRDIWQYLSRHDLPYHPLWHEGYVSIGDVHTTARWRPGMRAEDTRYFGLKRECGIHLEV